jgi:hypothetical protein
MNPQVENHLSAPPLDLAANGTLFRDIVSAFKAAVNGGWTPDTGFVFETVRFGDGTGTTLIVRSESKKHLGNPSEWLPQFYMEMPEGGSASGPLEGGISKLEAVPVNKPLDFQMSFGPQRCANDNSL